MTGEDFSMCDIIRHLCSRDDGNDTLDLFTAFQGHNVVYRVVRVSFNTRDILEMEASIHRSPKREKQRGGVKKETLQKGKQEGVGCPAVMSNGTTVQAVPRKPRVPAVLQSHHVDGSLKATKTPRT
ncbi:hypothetical protein DPEC_G00049730 [Dallia pectoralis]|uniref:Uncharacterized protein n=1 Tax=Dallia pectoralis TaxID=75939 RepID=A0ACC2HBH8_DALPE|nr:hypothetical protein DPEC_G00049730 [Dallia pectoralis]